MSASDGRNHKQRSRLFRRRSRYVRSVYIRVNQSTLRPRMFDVASICPGVRSILRSLVTCQYRAGDALIGYRTAAHPRKPRKFSDAPRIFRVRSERHVKWTFQKIFPRASASGSLISPPSDSRLTPGAQYGLRPRDNRRAPLSAGYKLSIRQSIITPGVTRALTAR